MSSFKLSCTQDSVAQAVTREGIELKLEIVWIIHSGTSVGQQKDNSQDKRELHSH